jgi:chromosome segregation ATPase
MQTFPKILLICALLGLSCAVAADQAPPTGTTVCKWVGDEKVCTTYKQKKKTYGPGFLKPDEVKQCLLDKRRIAADDAQIKTDVTGLTPESDAIAAEDKALQARGDEIKAQGEKLAAQRKEIDTLGDDLKKSEPGVAANEREVDRYQKKADIYTQKVTAFNPQNEAYKKQVDDFNAQVNTHHARVVKQNQAADDVNARLAALKNFAADFDSRCTQAQSYDDDVKAAEAAIARDDAAQKK